MIHPTHYTWYTQHITLNTYWRVVQNMAKKPHSLLLTFCPSFSQFITHLYYWGWGHSNKHWTFESCFYCFRLHQTDFYKHFWQLRFLLARIDMTWGLFHEDNRYPSSASIAMASTSDPVTHSAGWDVGTNRPRPVAGTTAPPIVSTISRLETTANYTNYPAGARSGGCSGSW